MPTTYTSALYDGKSQTFAQFAMQCARNFGACIEMRDEPWSKPIPEEFPYDDYHDRALEEARERLVEVESMTLTEAEVEVEEEYSKAVEYYNNERTKRDTLRKRYTDMLEQVNKWIPPTSGHKGLKDFMIQQLTESIEWDCRVYPEEFPKMKAAQKWLDENIRSCRQNVAYHKEGAAKEKERARGNSQWVRDLRRSLEK